MSSLVKIEQVEFFTDARGVVVEPISEEHLPGQRNVHVVLTEPGGIRGNHYHEVGTEILVVIGPALVRLRENGLLRDVCIPERQAVRFTVPPGISHAIQNQGSHPMLLMCFNTMPHDRAHPDMIRDVLISP